MTLLKDLIEIPERVYRGDYVLHLAEDVHRAKVVLENYVVTDELRACFDDALGFIKSALESRTSKASYLHGSFGAGKSHFMAVLHEILQGNADARGIADLAGVIQKHNPWLEGKKFLLVPYHMLGSHDMESSILGGYVDFIRRNHSQARIPGVYLAEGLFRDAQALRAKMGDEAFFAALGQNTAGQEGWGDLESGWNELRFETAMAAPPGSEERAELVGALVATFFGSYDTQAGGRGEAFLSLDKGLSVISRHAATLGYDAVILFLDELVLWLAQHAADLKFVHQEGQKLAKLVEAQSPDRPVPIVSFVARQRDLRELIGESVPGADRLNFGDALRHWEGRFHKITLEDRNLPAIAEKRVLKCKSESARDELDAAFDETRKIRETAMNVLLTGEGDRKMFRQVYPFSPALVQTLIAVSSVLQRERTALKVMVQLLVEQRDTLRVGDIVPVGDLFDTIAHGDEAFSPEMAIHFENAKRLYHQKLLPVLEKEHGARREEIEKLPYGEPKREAFRNDDRLIKTLLLAALVPEVESLRGLNAERLAALNHGTIKTPIPGKEAGEVLRRCRGWAAAVGEIRIGQEANPTIAIQLSGVDTERIIKRAEREDNHGNRMRRVRQMLFEQLDIQGEDQLEQFHEFSWRNTKRNCTVLFKNIRELSDTSLANSDASWKLVIDYPFDEQGFGPRDDLSRLQKYSHGHDGGAKTICWAPGFLSADAQKDLGLLVVLEHVLSGDRFSQYASELSPQDRPAAKSVLENQRSVLGQRVQSHLDAAYGLDALLPNSLDPTHDLELSDRFVSLWPGFDLQPPIAANLPQAIQNLVFQALEHEFPAAPLFGAEIRTGNLNKVLDQVMPSTAAVDGRASIEKALRPLLRQIAEPLLLGEMGPDATHFVLGHHWRTHFTRKAAETGGEMSVEQLRRWIDDPRPMGLPKEAQNLVIVVFAAQTNRGFFLHGSPCEVSLTNLPEKCEVRQQKLPDTATWSKAVARAASIFGFPGSPLASVANLGQLAVAVKKKCADGKPACQAYWQRLKERTTSLNMAPAGDRIKTAAATLALVDRLCELEPAALVEALAAADVASSEAAMAGNLVKAAELDGNLNTAGWEIFEALEPLTDERRAEAQQILSDVRQALASDEHAVPLASALKGAQAKAVRLLTKQAPRPFPPPPPLPAPPLPPPPPGKAIVDQGSRQNLGIDEAKELLTRLEGKMAPNQTARIHITWTIEKPGP
ncbi:MAG TPA: DUF6079 family protein [Pirellulales bacterium]|nr:DUF6079 family protein [Pirellulales bacterium]